MAKNGLNFQNFAKTDRIYVFYLDLPYDQVYQTYWAYFYKVQPYLAKKEPKTAIYGHFSHAF